MRDISAPRRTNQHRLLITGGSEMVRRKNTSGVNLRHRAGRPEPHLTNRTATFQIILNLFFEALPM